MRLNLAEAMHTKLQYFLQSSLVQQKSKEDESHGLIIILGVAPTLIMFIIEKNPKSKLFCIEYFLI